LLQAVISSPRGSYLLRPQFQDGRFIEFSALTPPDTLFTLQISSNTLSLADNAGNLLPASAVFSVRSPKPRDPNAPPLALPGMFRTRSVPKALTLLEVQAKR